MDAAAYNSKHGPAC